jgi:hypothetical protein
MKWTTMLAGLCCSLSGLVASAASFEDLQTAFASPPASARPWVYWFPLDGNLSREGITADLEAMQRVGIGGVLIMEVDQGAPKGPARFAGPLWRELFKHACSEAHRLGLQVNMNNDAGWCGSGGPWITPDKAMQKVVWTETAVEGPRAFKAALQAPPKVADFYRDIAVLAFPTPAGDLRLEGIEGKACFQPISISLDTPADWPPTPVDQAIATDKVLNLTDRLKPDGTLEWAVPEGKWTILRLGHTPTGKDNHPAPQEGRGLECDKLSKAGADAMFEGLMAKLIADVGPLAGKTLVSTHIDSWEVGYQNWTAEFREEFRRRRGYDLLPFLPAMTGRVVHSVEQSERFLWDLRQTISELLLDNYAGRFRELARKHGLRLSIEAYTNCPTDEMAYAGRADEPMAEFWSWTKYAAAFSCTEMISAAHVYGKPIIGAEAFTAGSGEKWQGHPANIKDLGDWAFCEGINRFVFHRYALQPWGNVRPGMSMGPWGLHYERTQTWWEQSKAWHEYLARCQYLLQQGLFTADICMLSPEGSPQTLSSQRAFQSPASGEPEHPLERPGYNFDTCPPEVVLTRMSVKDGRLVLPDGMSYRVLVLPRVETMTPRLLRKIKELVEAGATVMGAPPEKSPSLEGYPRCDEEVGELAKELWGDGATAVASDKSQDLATFSERSVGKGKVVSGGGFGQKPSVKPALQASLKAAKWIWLAEGKPAHAAPVGKRYFRRIVTVDAGQKVESAGLIMTADNAFVCWVNGREVGAGDNFGRTYVMDVTPLLKPGENVVAVEATNGADHPNPAGLIGAMTIRYANGRTEEMHTDKSWQAAAAASGQWTSTVTPAEGWSAAMELGALGMRPWGDIQHSTSSQDLYADVWMVGKWLAKTGLRPDFSYAAASSKESLRYTHRRVGGTDVYFVANKFPQAEAAVCSFRAQGRRPELWWPDTGKIERPAVYDEADGCVRVPINLDPSGSVFVVFAENARSESDRVTSVVSGGQVIVSTIVGKNGATQPPESVIIGSPAVDLVRNTAGQIEATIFEPGVYTAKTADGRSLQFEAPSVAKRFEAGGPWQVRFAPGGGAPEEITLPKLISWSEHSDPGVKYFSGTATYTTRLQIPADAIAKGRRWFLDLGRVEVMAEVSLNGEALGTLWKPPFRVEVTKSLRAGNNELTVKVVNLWINRMIGDEQLPEDSDRNPNGTLKAWPKWIEEGKSSPTGRFTFTSWRLWKKSDPLVPSGLLGPVTLQPVEVRLTGERP